MTTDDPRSRRVIHPCKGGACPPRCMPPSGDAKETGRHRGRARNREYRRSAWTQILMLSSHRRSSGSGLTLRVSHTPSADRPRGSRRRLSPRVTLRGVLFGTPDVTRNFTGRGGTRAANPQSSASEARVLRTRQRAKHRIAGRLTHLASRRRADDKRTRGRPALHEHIGPVEQRGFSDASRRI